MYQYFDTIGGFSEKKKKQNFTYFKGEMYPVNRLVSGASRVSTGNGKRATEPVVFFFLPPFYDTRF